MTQSNMICLEDAQAALRETLAKLPEALERAIGELRVKYAASIDAAILDAYHDALRRNADDVISSLAKIIL